MPNVNNLFFVLILQNIDCLCKQSIFNLHHISDKRENKIFRFLYKNKIFGCINNTTIQLIFLSNNLLILAA